MRITGSLPILVTDTYFTQEQMQYQSAWELSSQLLRQWISSQSSLWCTDLHFWDMNHHRIIFLIIFTSFSTSADVREILSEKFLSTVLFRELAKCSHFHIRAESRQVFLQRKQNYRATVYPIFCFFLEHRRACRFVTPSLQQSANPEEKYSPTFKSRA